MPRITITELAKQLPDEESAYKHLEKMRWNGKPVCPHCGSENEHYFLTPQGDGRKTRTGTISTRRVWKCRDCRKQFSVTSGTIFHGTRVPLQIWIFVLFEMTANKNGIAAREIERKYGVAPKTAWLMTQKIRAAMSNRAPHMMAGTIVADEAWIGGDPINDHHWKPEEDPEQVTPGGGGRPNQKTAKTPILCLINKETGEARTAVVTDVTGKTLRKHIAEHVDMDSSVLMTDEAKAYKTFSHEFQAHETVNHSEHEYVRGLITSNQAENYFSQLKRSIDGTHHSISKEHLNRYLGEFDFRYSTCKMDDTERMGMLIDQTAGLRVSYKRIKRG
jgi:transposase-like protein